MNLEEMDIVLENYELLQESEIHFAKLQFQYRQYAIYWFMGVFAAYGFVISKKISFIPIDQLFLLCCIAFAGSIGLMLLWSIDILLYQKLLDGIFIQELEMEKKYDFLPQTRQKMLFFTKGYSAIKIQTNFYVGIISLCLIASIFTLIYSQISHAHWFLLIFLPLPIFFILFLFIKIYKKSGDTYQHIKEINNYQDKENEIQ